MTPIPRSHSRSAFLIRLFSLALALLPSCASLDSFLFAPTRTDHYDLADATVPEAQRDLVRFAAADGTKLSGVLARQSDSQHALTVLYSHGNAQNIDYYWARASLLWSFGYNVFIYDYRGYGMSDGSPTEQGVYSDAQGALAWLRARSDLDPTRIAYYGYSLGGAVAIDLATRSPPRALVTESAFASVAELAEDGSLVVPPDFVATYKFDNVDKIGSVGAPVLIMHGNADTYIQPKYAHELYGRAAEPKRMELFDGATHDTVPYVDPGRYHDVVTSFLAND
jgi:fermentation-respiration switch protein FrsA (DUF1100 family)